MKQHTPDPGPPGPAAAMAACAAVLAAATAVAHVVESTLPAFLSRHADAEEAAVDGFNTFKPEETVIVIR